MPRNTGLREGELPSDPWKKKKMRGGAFGHRSFWDRLVDRLLGSSPDQVHRRLKKRGWYDG